MREAERERKRETVKKRRRMSKGYADARKRDGGEVLLEEHKEKRRKMKANVYVYF